jgi:hypothetical protein
MPCCLLLCQNNNDRIAFCFMFFFSLHRRGTHNLHTALAIHRSMLGNSTITRNNDTNAYIIATMNNISAALDSRSMSVGRFILLGVLAACGLVRCEHPTMTHFGGIRRRSAMWFFQLRSGAARWCRCWSCVVISSSCAAVHYQ